MNRNEFLRLIESSGPSDRQSIGEVSELIEVFPYFQSAYMLLLKGMSNTSDVRLENQLRLSAMHIADREVLYYFLKPVAAQKADIPKLQDEALTEESQQVVIEMAKNSEDLISEIEKSTESLMMPSGDKDASGDQIRQVSIQAESDNGDSVATILLIDEESGEEEERVIFMDPGFSMPSGETEELLELESEEVLTAGKASADEHLILEELPDPRKLQSELIDKFILANPRIEPVREKSDILQYDIAKPFTEERGAFVTETLARIYTSQGYYSRAIEIYEKLSLKFPEKSSYFATQIEKVKELIKK